MNSQPPRDRRCLKPSGLPVQLAQGGGMEFRNRPVHKITADRPAEADGERWRGPRR